MSKVLTLVKKSDDVDDRDFREYWANNFVPSLLSIPKFGNKVVRIVHNHPVSLDIREDWSPSTQGWGGISEAWFDHPMTAKAFVDDPAVAEVIASHSVMIPEVVHLPCWELRAWDNGLEKPTVKLMAFFHPADGMSRRESQYYWTNKHIEVGSKLNDPIRYAPRYVQNHVLPEYHATNPAYDFAGCPELWFYSTEAARKLFSETDPVNQDKLVADEVKFSNRQKTLPFVTDEVLVYERKPESNC